MVVALTDMLRIILLGAQVEGASGIMPIALAVVLILLLCSLLCQIPACMQLWHVNSM